MVIGKLCHAMVATKQSFGNSSQARANLRPLDMDSPQCGGLSFYSAMDCATVLDYMRTVVDMTIFAKQQ